MLLPYQEHVGHYINKFTETGPDFIIKYLLRAIQCGVVVAVGVVVVVGGGGAAAAAAAAAVAIAVVVVLAVVVVIVPVPMAVVIKSFLGLVNTNWRP